MGKGTKNINIEISTDCWKKLKIISIERDITLQEVVRDMLEKSSPKIKYKSIDKVESNEEKV